MVGPGRAKGLGGAVDLLGSGADGVARKKVAPMVSGRTGGGVRRVGPVRTGGGVRRVGPGLTGGSGRCLSGGRSW